jgi:hypothetical protein
VKRIPALIAIVVGVAIIGFNPNRWDWVILELPRQHGIHVHDVIGVALVALGVISLWRAPRAAKR